MVTFVKQVLFFRLTEDGGFLSLQLLFDSIKSVSEF